MSINCLAIPTCGRPDLLERALHSYAAHFKTCLRQVEIFVADDSRNPDQRALNRQALSRVRNQFGTHVAYAGIEEKLLFLKKLASFNDVPPEVLKFALFDSERTGLTPYGANRNALLLHNIGRALLSVDDDTVCAVFQPTAKRDGFCKVHPRLFSESDPCEVYILDQGQPATDIEPATLDLLGLHEGALGRRAGELHHEEDQREVAITFNGVVGDPGWPSTSIYHLLTADSFRRFAPDDETYDRSLRSRMAVRVATRASVGSIVNAPGMFAAFNNRSPIPPFVPFGRGEDVMLWTIIARFAPELTFCHLPVALEHRPGGRSVSPGAGGAFDTFMLMIGIFRAFQPDPSQASAINQLANFLMRFERMPDAELLGLIRGIVAQEGGAMVQFLCKQLDDCEGLSAACATHLQKMLTRARTYARGEVALIPGDLACARTDSEALALFKRAISRFGHLLHFWPIIRSNALEMAKAGVRLGKPCPQ